MYFLVLTLFYRSITLTSTEMEDVTDCCMCMMASSAKPLRCQEGGGKDSSCRHRSAPMTSGEQNGTKQSEEGS